VCKQQRDEDETTGIDLERVELLMGNSQPRNASRSRRTQQWPQGAAELGATADHRREDEQQAEQQQEQEQANPRRAQLQAQAQAHQSQPDPAGEEEPPVQSQQVVSKKRWSGWYLGQADKATHILRFIHTYVCMYISRAVLAMFSLVSANKYCVIDGCWARIFPIQLRRGF